MKFLASHQTITVAMQTFNPPYTFSGEKGELAGILPDYYTLLGKEMGIHFTFQVYPSAAAALTAVHEGKAQFLGLFSGSQDEAYKDGLRLIDISGNRNLVTIYKVNHTGKKVAVTKRNLLFLQQRLSGQDYEFLPQSDNEACYQALKNNQVDSIICTDMAATWIFNNHRTDGYSMIPLTLMKKVYTAVPVTADNSLYSLISKSVRKVAPRYNGIVIANVSPQSNFSSFFARLPFWGLVVFAIIMAILVVLLVMLIIILSRRYQERSLLAAREAENEKEKIRLEGLEKNAEEKNQFFANISHDLRTPLNAILGFSILARQSKSPEEQETYLEKISSSGKLMLDLVNDTLTMSKLRSGKLELKLEPVTSDPLIIYNALFDVIREQTTAKKITFTVNTSLQTKRMVLIDKLNMQKVLLNLLTNAVKYTPAGGHINVHFWNEIATDGKLDSLVSVQDDGIGIAPEFHDKVFEPFWQERRPGYETTGTGLGLAIVKQLVALMGGTITVSSTFNQGSTFTVRFRLQEVPAKTDTTSQSVQATTTNTRNFSKLAGHKILLCEDNKLNQEIAVALLKSQGMEVITADDGRQGVETFSTSAPGEFAAVLMDLRMPVLDGYAATKEIRVQPRTDAQTIPIIALTAETFAEDIQKCLDIGMNDHVAKPLVPEILFSTLAKHIK